LTLPSLLARTAGAKKRQHHKHHKRKRRCRPACEACQSCIQKTCQPAADGTSCPGGTCRGGGSEGCTLADDGTLLLNLATDVDAQTLRLVQTIQPFGASGASASRSELTLDGAPLLTIETAEDAATLTVTLAFGTAVTGVRQARLVNDGQTLTGTIDGQPIAPLSRADDPEALRLASGELPPELVLDPALETAIAALLTEAEQMARARQPPARASPRAAAARGGGEWPPRARPIAAGTRPRASAPSGS
jgi:hypothetical protein